MTDVPQAATGPTWRFRIGVATFILAFAIHLITLVVFLAGANAATVAAVGATMFALNKVLLIATVAILGRDGFNRIKAMLFGGEPLDAPRHMWWNFVSSSKERIEQARQEWKTGKFDIVPGDEEEFIPLPQS